MALFERKSDADSVTGDAATRALSVAAVDNHFVDNVYDKLAKVYDLFFGPTLHPGRLRAIERILSQTPADATTLAGLGRQVGASARTLSRLWRDELGMTFYEWRTQLRVHHALVLLAEGHGTTHTAHACGWANPSGFIAAFTDLVGTTPGRYRAGG